MSRKQRILLILTEAQYVMITRAVGRVDGTGIARVALEASALRDAHADMRALVDVAQLAVTSSCNCAGAPPPHESDCPIMSHRATFDRIEALRKLFEGAL